MGLQAQDLYFELFKPIQHVQQAGCNPLLVGLPFEKAHCPVAVIEKPEMADANVIKWLAVEDIMPRMASIEAWAQWAQAKTHSLRGSTRCSLKDPLQALQ